MSVHSSAQFLIGLFGGFLLLGCVGSLYILDINPLLNKWFANIFPHSGGCLLLIVSFAVQKLFSLMSSLLLIFAFVTCAFGLVSKKIIAKTNVKELFPFVFF